MSSSKSPEIDLTKFASLLAKKRARRPLRDVAAEIGDVSASTLSRIEKGNVPDLITFMKICRWLGVSPQEFSAATGGSPQATTFDISYAVCAQLRADRSLPPETAKALVTMIQLAYKDLTSGNIESEDQE